ncbi:alkaline phosphatase family protein [Rhizobium freirei]|uniref:alkaline phosphatase family protein n=1 Tax=Rhizobium freirei TaxID=1353277 RepID=UPI0003A660B5|nr:alkaline phosphatase family protein [Rhizobium freirei]
MSEIAHVIILGVDGLRPDQINAVTMPNLHALKQRGVVSSDHRTVFPSETRGALSALANGAKPESTGILGNDFYARDGGNRLAGTDTIHDWRHGEAQYADGMVHTVNLSETLAKAGRSFAVVTSSGQGSFTALNWKGAELGQTGFNVRHPQLAFPHDLAIDITARHKVPSTGFERGAEAKAVDIFVNSVWPAKKPSASIIWLTEVDSASHLHGLGTEGQIESLIQCDAAIGTLLDWREHQPERDAIAVFITSDHGHSTSTRFINVGDAFKAAGIRAATRFDDDVDIIFRRGRAPGLWLRRYDKGLLQAAFDAIVAQDWYGATFTRAIEPGSPYGRIEGTLAMELTGAAHFRAPDLYINLAGDNAPNEFGVPGTSTCDVGNYKIDVGGGTHGGLHLAELTAVLIADGAGLKAGGQVITTRTGITDLAPTCLHMLGIAAPDTMTGRVMHELLESGEATAAPVCEEFTATAQGKTSQLRFGRVGSQSYIDEAWASPAAAVPSVSHEAIVVKAPAE